MESDTGEQSQQIEETTRGRGRGRRGCGHGGRGCTSHGVAGKTTTAPKKSSPVKKRDAVEVVVVKQKNRRQAGWHCQDNVRKRHRK